MKNNGTTSQFLFEAAFLNRKAVFLERRTDLKEFRGLNPSITKVVFPAQPSDYLLTINGQTHYVEVKSSTNKTSFPFSQIEPGQWKAATQVTAAGGSYVFMIHSLHLNQWYKVPAHVILEASKERSSLSWKTLQPYATLLGTAF